MARQDELEARVDELARSLLMDFADLGGELRWSIARALIHRAVHFVTEKVQGAASVEYCTLAAYLGEMVGHAHTLAHGDNPKGPSHRDLTH